MNKKSISGQETNGVELTTAPENYATVIMSNFIADLDEREREVMKLENEYQTKIWDTKTTSYVVFETNDPITTEYGLVENFLFDLETFENSWEVESITKYEDGMSIVLVKTFTVDNLFYDQKIEFMCTGDFEEHNMEV